MTNPDMYEQWQSLCDKHEIARDAHYKALSIVNGKFRAVAKGASGHNPSSDDLLEFERTWSSWESVKREMAEFVKSHI